VLQRDAKEKRRKEGGKEAGNREAHAGNRADPTTQADAEHSRSSKSHTGAQTNRNKEEEQPHTAQARKTLRRRVKLSTVRHDVTVMRVANSSPLYLPAVVRSLFSFTFIVASLSCTSSAFTFVPHACGKATAAPTVSSHVSVTKHHFWDALGASHKKLYTNG
jgi:hypothetical protein